MFVWLSRLKQSKPSCIGANHDVPWFACSLTCVAVSPAAKFAIAPDQIPAFLGGGFLGGFAIGCLLVLIVTLITRAQLKAARQEAEKARELADHREYERNLAQQELVRRLEEERCALKR